MNDYVVTINGKLRNVNILENDKVNIEGKEYPVTLREIKENLYLLKIGSHYFHFSANKKESDVISFSINGKMYESIVRSALQEKANSISKAGEKHAKHVVLKAPMPGKIIKICKIKGEEVVFGESLLILEAMKMENNISSPTSGVIKKLLISEGNTVEKGAVLLEIE